MADKDFWACAAEPGINAVLIGKCYTEMELSSLMPPIAYGHPAENKEAIYFFGMITGDSTFILE